MARIKYKAEVYECSILDWAHIKRKTWKFKRQKRRATLLLSRDRMLIYMILILLWVVYLLAVFTVGIINKSNVSYLELLLQSRDNIFITIIIAFSTEAFNRFREYTSNIKKQHYLYVDSMVEFETLLKPLMGKYALHYHPMYNLKCFNLTKNYIKERAIPCLNYDSEAIVKTIYDRINSIERELKKGLLYVESEELLCLHLDEAKSCINRFLVNHDEELYWEIVDTLYDVQNDLRYPWRIDENDNKEILRLLYKNNKESIECDFYLRMQLDDFNFEILDNQIARLDKEIQLIKKKYSKNMLKFEK